MWSLIFPFSKFKMFALYSSLFFATMGMELINVDNLSRVELQNLCKPRGVHVGTKATEMELQIAIRAFEEVKTEERRGGEECRP